MVDKQLFVKTFAAPFKKAGFVRKGQSWYLNGEDALVVINLQKARDFFCNQYFINVGIWLKAFQKVEFPRFNHCHLYYRAEGFFPEQSELILTSCALELSNIELLAQFTDFLERQFIPFLRELTNEQYLRKLMVRGTLDRGLVRTEAREYLTNSYWQERGISMDELRDFLQEILKKHIGIVEKDLRISKQDSYPQAVIYSGTWANQNLVTAFTSLFPTGDASEESIDLMIQLKLSETEVEYLADVSRSNGELIRNIASKVITFSSQDDLLTKVENLTIEVCKALSDSLKDLDSWTQ